MRRSKRQVASKTLIAYLEGELGSSDAKGIEAEIAASPALKGQLDRLRSIREGLASVDEAVENHDLVPGLRRAIEREAQKSEQPAKRWWRPGRRLGLAAALVVGAGVVATAVFVGSGIAPPSRPADDQILARGGPADGQDLWVGLHLLRAADGGSYARVADTISAGDGLAFGYSNVGPKPFSHLMIFGVDARGEVFWFYPAYESAASNPRSLPIQPRADVELRDVVRHALRPGPLAVYAIFTRTPLRVRQVESEIARLISDGRWSAATPARLPLARSAQKIVRLEVVP